MTDRERRRLNVREAIIKGFTPLFDKGKRESEKTLIKTYSLPAMGLYNVALTLDRGDKLSSMSFHLLRVSQGVIEEMIPMKSLPKEIEQLLMKDLDEIELP